MSAPAMIDIGSGGGRDWMLRCPVTGRQVFSGIRSDDLTSMQITGELSCPDCGGWHLMSTADLERPETRLRRGLRRLRGAWR